MPGALSIRRLVCALAAASLLVAAGAAKDTPTAFSAAARPVRAQPYAGKTLMPREVAAHAASSWGGIGLVKATATALGESRGSVGAYHDNIDAGGNLTSRDCGIFQINIPASQVGTELERQLRTDSLDPPTYTAVAAYNTDRAKQLYNRPWWRNDRFSIRMWQPWVAYTAGWATFPEWWIWARPWLDHWAPTGRYLQQAIAGVANYRLVIARDANQQGALWLARRYQAIFRVQGTLGIRNGIIAWVRIPPKPQAPPADGVGPRPKPNDGR